MQSIRRMALAVTAALALMAIAGAASASASKFVAGQYPATVTGASLSGSLNFSSASYECPMAFQGGLSGTSGTLGTTAGESYCYGEKGKKETTKMNGCGITFQPGIQASTGYPPGFGSSFGGTFTIGPPGCGPIVAKVPNCTYSILPGSGFTPEISYLNRYPAGKRAIRIDAVAKSLVYTSEGPICFKGSPLSYRLSWEASAKTSLGEATDLLVSSGGAYIAGSLEEEEGLEPRITADVYPTSIASGGADTFTFKVNAGTFSCTQSGLSAEVTKQTTNQALGATFNECTGAGYPSAVKMNSCHFDLGVQNVGPPFTGTLGVSCSKEGDGIEFSAYNGKNLKLLLCTAKVSPQSGISGVGLSNVFEPATGIKVSASVSGMKYEQTGPYCTNGAQTNGVLGATATLFGL